MRRYADQLLRVWLQSMKVCPHVKVPERGLVSIQQLVSELNNVRPGAKLSKDRLTRVTQGNGAPDQRAIVQVITYAPLFICQHAQPFLL